MNRKNNAFTAPAAMVRDGFSFPTYVSGDSAISNRKLALAASRHMYQNNALYASLINRLCDVITGPSGADLMVTTGEDDLNDMIETVFDQWAKRPEITGRFDWQQLQRIISRELFIAGECLLVKVRGQLKLQVIESERIKTANVDAVGQYTSFVVTDPAAQSGYTTVSAADCLFISAVLQPSQTRGTSPLWSCIDVINMVMSILRSSAKSWGLVSRLAFVIKKAAAGQLAFNESYSVTTDCDGDGTADVLQDDDDTNNILERFQNFGDGVIGNLEPGEDIAAIPHSGVPNSDLEKQLLIYLRVVSSTIGIDAATTLLNDWSKTNWSSSKAANEALSHVASTWQQLLFRQFHSRVFRWVIGSVAANEETALPDRPEIFEHRFIGYKPSVLDEEKQAKSIQLMMSQGTLTHSEALLQRGIDRAEQLKRIKKEILDAVRDWSELQRQTEEINPGFILPPELFSRFIGVELSQTANAIRVEQQENEDSGQET